MSQAPLPPSKLIGRVGVEETGDSEISFFHGSGQRSKRDVLSALPADWTWPNKSVLDFGCGSGRLLRHFIEEGKHCDFWACDIDEDSVHWISEHLAPSFKPYVCGPDPPLPHKPNSLDLIYAVSVFSHLAPNWAEWACELHRVLRAGGLLVISIHGSGDWKYGIAGQRGIPFDEERIGMHVEHFGSGFDNSWGPAVYVSEWWFREHWGRAFDVVGYFPHGFAGSAEEKRAGAGQAWAVLAPIKTKSPSPLELTRSRHGEPREFEAAIHSRDLVYAEVAHLYEGELRRLTRDWYAYQERIRVLEDDHARIGQALSAWESSLLGRMRSLAHRLRGGAR